MKPHRRPIFTPLYAGKGGQGKGKTGYPTPLTHPAAVPDPRGGFVHPINDPRLKKFFSTRKVEGKQKGGWIPPEPPIIHMGEPMQQDIPIGRQVDFPTKQKASLKGKKRRTMLPMMMMGTDDSESSDEETFDHIKSKKKAPKRRKMLVQTSGGKMVLAEYWDI